MSNPEERIARFPELKCLLADDATGTLNLAFSTMEFYAETIAEARIGVVSQAARQAKALERPVRLVITERNKEELSVGVWADACVARLSETGDATHPAHESGIDHWPTAACTWCRSHTVIAGVYCTQCGKKGPHQLLIRPNVTE